MGKWPTVFSVEIQAILECCNVCLRIIYRHSNIYIMSDSQAALNALKSAKCTSKRIWECVPSLQKLACRNHVNLFLGIAELMKTKESMRLQDLDLPIIS